MSSTPTVKLSHANGVILFLTTIFKSVENNGNWRLLTRACEYNFLFGNRATFLLL